MPSPKRLSKVYADARTPDTLLARDGYSDLAAAFLAQVWRDAHCQHDYLGYISRDQCQAEARAFLSDTEAVRFWCEVIGADAAPILAAMHHHLTADTI